MRSVSIWLALAALSVSACKSEAKPPVARAGCPVFPPKTSNSNSGVFASTSFGGDKVHSPPAQNFAIPTGPISGVTIVLERHACYGTCPTYRVEIHGDGTVLFRSGDFVTFAGTHRTHISPLMIECLLDDFRSVDFWSLDPEYRAQVTDNPEFKVSLTIGGKTKELTDYVGRAVGMPAGVTALEDAIDQAAGTNPWIVGDDKTIPALEAEHFNFHSRAAADLLATAVQDAPEPIVLGLLERGAPIDGLSNSDPDEDRISTIEGAAMNGRLGLMKRLIAAGAFAKGGRALISATLRASVASQRVDVVAEILKHHPDVNSRNKAGDTALALIFTGAHPHAGDPGHPDENAAIVRMLGKAGADPNLPNSAQESLLNLAYSKDDKAALIAIGTHPPPATKPN